MNQTPKSSQPVKVFWLLIAVGFLLVVPMCWSVSRAIVHAQRAAAPPQTHAFVDHVLLQLDLATGTEFLYDKFPTDPLRDRLRVTVGLWETDAIHDGIRVTTATLLTSATLSAREATSITIQTTRKVVATVLGGNAMHYPVMTSLMDSAVAPFWEVRRSPPGNEVTTQILTVWPAAKITGRLLDQDARPIAGMSVEGYFIPPSHYAGESNFRVRTNRDGQFQVQSPMKMWSDDLLESRIYLESPGDSRRGPTSGTLTIRTPINDFPKTTQLGNVVFPLGEGYQSLYETYDAPRSQLSGRVVDKDGQLVTLKSVQSEDGSLNGGPLATISQSPDRSVFRFDGLTTGRKVLRIETEPPHLPFTFMTTIAEPSTSITLPDLVAPLGRTLRVRVLDLDTSQPVAGTTVSISTRLDQHNFQQINRSAVSGADGVAILAGLPRDGQWPQVQIGSISLGPTAYGPPTDELSMDFPVGKSTVRVLCDGTRGVLGPLALSGNGHFMTLPELDPQTTSPPTIHEFTDLPAGQYKLQSRTWEDYCVFANGQPEVTVKRGEVGDIVIQRPKRLIRVALPPIPKPIVLPPFHTATVSHGTLHFWLNPEESPSATEPTHYTQKYYFGQNIVVAVPHGQRLARMQFQDDKGRTATLDGDQLDRPAPTDSVGMAWDTEPNKP